MKILIIRLSSLGDLVLTTPVYQNIKKIWPNASISLLVKEKYASLLQESPYIDEIISFKEENGLFYYIRKIRAQKYDLLIDLHNNLRSNLIRFFSGAKKKIGYNKAIFARHFFIWTKRSLPELERHTVDRYLKILERMTVKPESKILVIQTAYLGDAVLTIPLLSRIKNSFPESFLSLLSTPEVEDIFAGRSEINEHIIYDKRGKERGLLHFLGLIRKIKERNFDLAILPHRSFRSALLVWLAGIPRRVGFSISEGRIFLTDLVSFDWRTHDLERNLKLLEPLGVGSSPISAELALNIEPEVAKDLFAQYNIIDTDLVIGINPGSIWPTKCWLSERFAQVADRLVQEKKAKIVIFGSEEDLPIAKEVEKGMRYPVINLAGKTTLKQLVSSISRCLIFITNDSGPMHIAVAMKVPTVAIFGPTTKELGFYPYGEKHKVVEVELKCRPCSLHGGKKCPLGHFNCMRMITAEKVYQTVNEILEGKN